MERSVFSVQGGTEITTRLLTDELWNEIEGFFPTHELSSKGSRPPAENRTVFTSILVFTCILFVLKTGIAREDLPLELECSYKKLFSP